MNTMDTRILEDFEEEEIDDRGENLSVPEPQVSYNSAQRGAMMSSDITPMYEAARQTGRQALFTWE